MATEIGALIVSLRANSAQFQAEMDKARKGMRGVGAESASATKQIAKLAADGFGAILPISNRVENQIERYIEKMLAAKNATALLGKATIAAGIAFGAFKLGSLIGEFITLGTTIENYNKQVKEATEEQQKFLANVAKQSTLLRSLRKELASASGNELGGFKLEQDDRDARIRETFTVADPRRQTALALSAQIRAQQEAKFLVEQQKLRAENEQKILDAIKKEQEAQLQAWQEETRGLVTELEKRVKARADFEKKLGDDGLGGPRTASSGIAAVAKIRKEFKKDLQDLAFLEREGLVSPSDSLVEQQNILQQLVTRIDEVRNEFRDVPSVIAAVDNALEPLHINFTAVSREMAVARREIETLAPSTQQLQAELGRVAQAFATTPPAAQAAGQAVRDLAQDYLNLQLAIYGATVQLLQYNQAAAGG